MASTLDGTYTPTVGDAVWQQMYQPNRGGATIAEKVTAGHLYGGRRLMVIVAIQPSEGGLTRWQLLPFAPKDRHGEFPWSCVEDDWCVLEPASADAGQLF